MRFLSDRVDRIFAYGKPVDLRKGFLGLQALIQSELGEDPIGGDLFVFINRRGDLLKSLFWDRTGFVIIAKRLERGKFRLRNPEGKVELDETRIRLLFDGIPVGGFEASSVVHNSDGPLSRSSHARP